jgi:hypothetical protein
MKTTSRTEKKVFAFESARRCGARTKSRNGEPCLCPAIKGKTRCRVHGGAKGSGAKLLNQNALKHGGASSKVKLLKREIRTVIKIAKQMIESNI